MRLLQRLTVLVGQSLPSRTLSFLMPAVGHLGALLILVSCKITDSALEMPVKRIYVANINLYRVDDHRRGVWN